MRRWIATFAVCVGVFLCPAVAGAAVPAFGPVDGATLSGTQIPSAVALSPTADLLAGVSQWANTVSTYSISSDGAVTQVPGSPYPAGNFPGVLAFSPSGGLLAVVNSGASPSVSMYSVSANGSLSPVPGSPFALAYEDDWGIAFNPAGTLLAVANGNGEVSVFQVAADGGLTPGTGSPYAVGTDVPSLSFSSDGQFLAAAEEEQSAIAVFAVGAGGQLTPVAGSPFTTGAHPVAVAFDPADPLLASANLGSGTIAMYAVGQDGGLTAVPGSPLAVGAPYALAFSENGSLLLAPTDTSGVNQGGYGLLALAVGSGGSLTPLPGSPFPDGCPSSDIAISADNELVATCPQVPLLTTVSTTISNPAANGLYTVGEHVPTAFACADTYGTGIASCTDSGGATTGSGTLDTASAGQHTYTVTAVSRSGRTRTAKLGYSVAYAPPVTTIAQPADEQTFPLGALVTTTFTCAESQDGTGLASCTDSNGSPPPTGLLDTSSYGRHTYTVTAISRDGTRSTATITYVIGPAGQVGFVIDGGAYATNSPGVELDPVWPVYTSSILIANDGGFGSTGDTADDPLATAIPWTLHSTGADRLPKTVYLRFLGAGVDLVTFTDSIVLDETPPVVSAARLLRGGSAVHSGRRARTTAYPLDISARDTIVGLCAVAASTHRAGGTIVRLGSCHERGIARLHRVIALKSTAPPRYVRVLNSAGSWSAWRTLRGLASPR